MLDSLFLSRYFQILGAQIPKMLLHVGLNFTVASYFSVRGGRSFTSNSSCKVWLHSGIPHTYRACTWNFFHAVPTLGHIVLSSISHTGCCNLLSFTQNSGLWYWSHPSYCSLFSEEEFLSRWATLFHYIQYFHQCRVMVSMCLFILSFWVYIRLVLFKMYFTMRIFFCEKWVSSSEGDNLFHKK